VCYIDSDDGYAHISDAEDSADDALSEENATQFICNLWLGNGPPTAHILSPGGLSPKTHTCYFDSGATRHVFHDRGAFVEYTKIRPLAVKGFDRAVTASAIGKGFVRLTSRLAGRKVSLLLTDVLHIPTAHSNLVSGALLASKGVNILSAGNTFTLFSGSVTVANGSMCGNMYQLDVRITQLAQKIVPPTRDLKSRIGPIAASVDSSQSGFGTA
jgi:hypothetical protein